MALQAASNDAASFDLSCGEEKKRKISLVALQPLCRTACLMTHKTLAHTWARTENLPALQFRSILMSSQQVLNESSIN